MSSSLLTILAAATAFLLLPPAALAKEQCFHIHIKGLTTEAMVDEAFDVCAPGFMGKSAEDEGQIRRALLRGGVEEEGDEQGRRDLHGVDGGCRRCCCDYAVGCPCRHKYCPGHTPGPTHSCFDRRLEGDEEGEEDPLAWADRELAAGGIKGPNFFWEDQQIVGCLKAFGAKHLGGNPHLDDVSYSIETSP